MEGGNKAIELHPRRSEDGEDDVGEEELRRARLLPHDGHARVEHRTRILRLHLGGQMMVIMD